MPVNTTFDHYLNPPPRQSTLNPPHGLIPCPLPAWQVEERIFEYDTEKYNFKGIVLRILELDNHPKSDILENLHETVAPERLVTLRSSRNCFNKKWRSAPKHLLDEFKALYRHFIKEVIAPLMKIENGQTIDYQTEPVFRCHLAFRGKNLGVRHTDAEYLHQPSEVNWWLPITNVFGTNTLWTESVPGKGDFHPITMKYGQIIRFYANQCEHYTLANTTDTTRISLDFRVVDSKYYDENWLSPARPKHRTESCYQRNGWYSTMKIN